MKECKRSCLFYIMEGGLLQERADVQAYILLFVQIFPLL